MATLEYGSSGREVEFDDRALAHLQIVMIAKLRRSESFAFSWTEHDHREGRRTIWVSPAQYLQFRYGVRSTPAINRDWIEALMASANSTAGLQLVPEPHTAAIRNREPALA
jgi:hypothetical protein